MRVIDIMDPIKYNREKNNKQIMKSINIMYTISIILITISCCVGVYIMKNPNLDLAIAIIGTIGVSIEIGFYVLFRKVMK